MKIEQIARFPLFREFPRSSLERLVSRCREVSLADKEILISEGSDDRSMYVVLSGTLLVHKLHRQIDVAGPGDYVGEMLLIDSRHRSATVRAIGDAAVMEIDEDSFREFILTEPAALYSMLGTFCERTRKLLDVVAGDFQRLNIFVHDMRNVIAGLDIPGFLMETLLENLRAAPAKIDGANLDEMEEAVTWLNSVRSDLIVLLEQSLAISTNRQLRYVKGPCALEDLVHETVFELSGHRDLRDKAVRVHTEEGVLNIFANSLDIKRVVQNLLLNAAQASQPGGEIDITLRKDIGCSHVSVADQGVGIPEELKPVLMRERYTTKPSGTGFGLLSCRQIVEDLHQGRLWFETGGNGTVFHFTIPLNPDEQYNQAPKGHA